MRRKIVKKMTHTIQTKTKEGNPLIINIRLSDPCHNGHNDWAITGSLFKIGTVTFSDRNLIACGVLHDDILKVKPSLKIFIDLHLSDESGAPLHAVENGYYNMCNSSLESFAQYMRIDIDEATKIKEKSLSKEQFSKWVDALRPRWRNESETAKNILSKMITESETIELAKYAQHC